MAPDKFTREEFWAELEEAGEEEVRARVNTGRYTSGNKKRELAQQWLDKKVHERAELSERRKEASQSEQIEIARSAKDAAWSAAEAARSAAAEAREQSRMARAANIRATIALIIATISATTLIIDLTLRIF